MLQKISWIWYVCLLLFLIHQVLEKLFLIRQTFLDSFLDPFLSIPIILGIHLSERRFFFKQGNLFVLANWEIIVLSVFLALLFEWGFPVWFEDFVSDPLDYLAYAAGMIFFWAFINKPLD